MVSIFEPGDCILVDASDSLRLTLQQIGWLTFIGKFHGHNLEMTRQFASTFDGRKAIIGNLELTLDQQTLAEATNLSTTGEEWFKGKYEKKTSIGTISSRKIPQMSFLKVYLLVH